MFSVKSKSRKRAPADAIVAPTAGTGHAPALTDEQLRVLHQVYSIILSHSKPAGAA